MSRTKRMKAPEHHAIFLCPEDRWLRIEAKHREILKRVVKPDTAILDAGCGWGRLLTLMPEHWRGRYLGVDVSPDFVLLANQRYPDRDFLCADILKGIGREGFDLAVMVSIRPMVKRHMGEAAWERMEREVRKCAKRLLYLEYSDEEEGFLE